MKWYNEILPENEMLLQNEILLPNRNAATTKHCGKKNTAAKHRNTERACSPFVQKDSGTGADKTALSRANENPTGHLSVCRRQCRFFFTGIKKNRNQKRAAFGDKPETVRRRKRVAFGTNSNKRETRNAPRGRSEMRFTVNKKKKGVRLFCEFVVPPMLIWALVVIMPLIYGVYLTFTNWNGLSPSYDMVGVQNYIDIFKDKTFLSSLLKTFVYVFCVVLFSNVLGIVLAVLLTSGIKAQGIFRTCFFAANMIGGIVMGYIWNYIFSFAVTKFGETVGWEALETSMLTKPATALAALIIVTVWQMSGYLMVIYVAGFTSISSEMVEAAEIDGATGMQLFRYIKLPMIRSSVTICTFIAISKAFMSFDVNLALTAGGPYKSTELLALKIYQTAFSNFEYGKGQAQAVVLFIIVAIVSLIQVTTSKKKEVQA